ncbi:hypothetical protein BC936DRAFT_144241 [Jimgerdemannia flammicorona]|uniref:Uncharacterized protein n=2 Tax=Jimgerdemannia flammicorona TaxID=994334 RepID=A0A433DCS3_9FUNG|nr:hypothetical protein BC936DRAFT_144241 [Jimgerdemannia flammicorona]RUS30825.1 hypothetical protein BC938DRAFT_478916 [Jimgerdemannia flammicorona]
MMASIYHQPNISENPTNCDHLPLTLPPELVGEVLLNLVGEEKSPLPLDFLASSMVCQTWNLEACHVVRDKNKWFISTFPPEGYSSADFQRFAKLIVESKRIGLNFHISIEEMLVGISYIADGEEYLRIVEAFRSILELQPPRLFYLEIHLASISLPLPSFVDHPRTLLDKIEPYCGAINSLALVDDETRSTPLAPVADFVTSLSSHLDEILLGPIKLDAQMHTALAQCTALKETYFDNMPSHDLPSVLPLWPELRRFAFEQSRSDQCDMSATITTLARSCPRLTAFEYEGHEATTPAVSNEALCFLVESCPELREFKMQENKAMDDTVLASLLDHAHALEELELYRCGNITGQEALVGERAGWWPNLQRLSLFGCEELSPAFVEKVVEMCPRLRSVYVLYFSRDNPEELVETFSRKGFVLTNNTTWEWEKS